MELHLYATDGTNIHRIADVPIDDEKYDVRKDVRYHRLNLGTFGGGLQTQEPTGQDPRLHGTSRVDHAGRSSYMHRIGQEVYDGNFIDDISIAVRYTNTFQRRGRTQRAPFKTSSSSRGPIQRYKAPEHPTSGPHILSTRKVRQ